jgi:hypothetical protein
MTQGETELKWKGFEVFVKYRYDYDFNDDFDPQRYFLVEIDEVYDEDETPVLLSSKEKTDMELELADMLERDGIDV